jgi:Tol biopolymer transport system component
MKIALLSLTILALATDIGRCTDNEPKQVKVETDHGGNPSDLSTDELVMTFSDGTKKNLTNNGSMERVPIVSHDDSTMAFLRRVDSNEDGRVNWDDEVELWIMRLDTRAEARLAKGLTDPSQATWQPKNQTLGFIATDVDSGRGLYSYDLPNKRLNRLTDNANSWPAWSASGNHIAFYDDKNRIVVFDFLDKSKKVLTDDVGNGWSLYWTTDGRLIFTVDSNKRRMIYTPGIDPPIPLTDEVHKKLTIIDQAKFGWASTEAEQDAP